MSHKILRTIFIGILITMLVTACTGGAAPGPTGTPTTDPATPAAATAAAQGTADAKAAADAKATADAKSTADAKATVDAKATADAGATATVVSKMTATQQAADAKATADMVAKQTKTAEAIAQKTATAKSLYDAVQKLVTDGNLTSADGSFQKLPDFSESLAMINFISPYPTALTPKNFVLRTDMSWESASDKANWFNSACGIIFHIDPVDNTFYSASLSLDGNVNIDQHKKNFSFISKIARKKYGKLDVPKGGAKFMLVVTGEQITVFINDTLVYSYKTDLVFREGMLAYSITSGTNKDFGTRCTLTNVELWELK